MRPFIIIGIVAFIILGLFIWMKKDKTRFDWKETYSETSKEPYGTFVMQELLENYYVDETLHVVDDSLHGNMPENPPLLSNYVFIGEGMYLDSADLQTLLTFVENGNNAFISSRSLPFNLAVHLNFGECLDWDDYWLDYEPYLDTLVNLRFLHPNLKDTAGYNYQYYYKNNVKNYRWHYINDYYFCEYADTLIPLAETLVGRSDTLVHFARMKYGDGAFYLHTVPLTFTNFHLIEETGLQYANKVFSHLTKGPIYWDIGNRISENASRRRNQIAMESPNKRLSNETPLQYVLSQPPLAWAWWLLLLTGLLYLIFTAKRRQRIIPVLEENTNTSLEFITTIGRLTFMQNNHRKLALQKMRLFLSYIRERYHLNLKPEDEDFVARLSTRSEVSKAIIDAILSYDKNIRSSSFTSENTLIELHKVMEQFYKQCK